MKGNEMRTQFGTFLCLAMFCAAGCGVSLLATAHAGNAQELHRRRLYRNLLREGVFHRAVEIRNVNGKRTYKVVELRCGF